MLNAARAPAFARKVAFNQVGISLRPGQVELVMRKGPVSLGIRRVRAEPSTGRKAGLAAANP